MVLVSLASVVDCCPRGTEASLPLLCGRLDQESLDFDGHPRHGAV